MMGRKGMHHKILNPCIKDWVGLVRKPFEPEEKICGPREWRVGESKVRAR